MELTQVILFLLGLVVTVLGGFGTVLWWIVKGIRADVDKHADSLEDHRLETAKTYASKEDMKTSLRDVSDRMDKVDRKLDSGFKDINDKIDNGMQQLNRTIMQVIQGGKG